MKKLYNIKSATIFLQFTVFIIICLMSCDFIIEKKNANNNSLNQQVINTNKNEAKLLVKASENNLDIIKLCQVIKDVKPEKEVKKLAKDIEKTHIEIFKTYRELASENLISIPIYSNLEAEALNTNLEKDEVVENNLDLISNKINEQIELLSQLSKTTNNVDLKEFSANTKNLLKQKLEKTKNTISIL